MTEDYSSLLKETVKRVPPYVPGKSVSETIAEYGLDPASVIKLSSNENPLGPSPKAEAAAREAAAGASVYPLADLRFLREAIASRTGFPVGSVVVSGPGMDSLIDSVCKIFVGSGDEVIISTPTFSFYEIAATICGGVPMFVPRKENFDIDTEGILKAVTEKTKIIFICSPNNPTGNLVSPEDVKKLAERSGCIVFLDEAYIEFADQESSACSLISGHDNIIVGRTFSKVYGLAGLRVGYGLMPEWIASEILRISLPFSVSVVTEAAAVAALADGEHVEKTRRMVSEGRRFFCERIPAETPFRAWPSSGNFIAVDVSPCTSREICDALLRDGIIIRSCDSFKGAGKSMVRITVGTAEMNRRVLDALVKAAGEK